MKEPTGSLPTEKEHRAPLCPYCHTPTLLHKNSSGIYGKNLGPAWVCKNYPTCDSYVGAHRQTFQPKGTPANSRLRSLRRQAHSAFDPLWKEGGFTRSQAYRFLAEKLNKCKADAHIGLFNEEECQKTIDWITQGK